MTFFPRELPVELKALTELAMDMRWTWSHAGDSLWRSLAPEIWERTKNPWIILQDVSSSRLEELARDEQFTAEVQRLTEERDQHLAARTSFQDNYADSGIQGIAYFSMEFGLGEAIPLYAGGLGILAGDYLKTASDLGLPLVGIGLLYQEGYFRQTIDATGQQVAAYPYNDPSSLPIEPVTANGGGWLHVNLEFPGRTLRLRVWRARVGRIMLYLLDSNDPFNTPIDRGITGKLYGGGQEMRLIQEMVLGIGGWRVIQALGLNIDICHLNEGHAAFVVLERARQFMTDNQVSFQEALWATRAGNIFTTHTPVAAGFDRYPPELIKKFQPYIQLYLDRLNIPLNEFLSLGRKDSHANDEPFNMAYLAMRGCSWINAVSRLHGEVSRRIFSELYPQWPEHEVPIGHVTNGVHMPTWDSIWADKLWSKSCGKQRWLGTTEELTETISRLDDAQLWGLCTNERNDLIGYARDRLAKQLGQRGADAAFIAQASHCLDPNALTIGFARRFAEYKRPNLLLSDPERLIRLLINPERPVQLIIAGKAHPQDDTGKAFIRDWIEFCNQPGVRHHAVFLEDYDISLAQELVQGVDLWLNTPRRPWEACGTSGMKVLVNGGLNLSELDGWWAEAYAPEYGWALGDGREHDHDDSWDKAESESLYRLLEDEIIPLFYQRDAAGIPQEWITRVRKSMAELTPRFSCNRMVHEYIKTLYQPAAHHVQQRCAEGGKLARELYALQQKLEHHWNDVHFGQMDVAQQDGQLQFQVPVYLGDLDAADIRVELYADPFDNNPAVCQIMQPAAEITGAINGYLYSMNIITERPAEHFTPRIIAANHNAMSPLEIDLIHWQR